MRRVLHIICDAEQTLPEELLTRQRAQADLDVHVFRFDEAEPNYRKLLQEIFEADSIEVC